MPYIVYGVKLSFTVPTLDCISCVRGAGSSLSRNLVCELKCFKCSPEFVPFPPSRMASRLSPPVAHCSYKSPLDLRDGAETSLHPGILFRHIKEVRLCAPGMPADLMGSVALGKRTPSLNAREMNANQAMPGAHVKSLSRQGQRDDRQPRESTLPPLVVHNQGQAPCG